jgi:uncharacterized protein with beta-barrel porin domain
MAIRFSPAVPCARPGTRVARWWRIAALALSVFLLVHGFATPGRADDVFVVNSTADDGSAGTLRWAIEQANAGGAGTHSIGFSLAPNATVSLTSDLPMLNNSAGTISLDGAGANGLTIDGNGTHRALFVATGNVFIANVNFMNGAANGGAGAGGAGGGGGGLGAGGALFVNDTANVIVQNVTFQNNAATGGSGGGGSLGNGGGGGGGLGGNGGSGSNGGGGGGGFLGGGGPGSNGGGGGGGVLGSGGNGSNGGGGGGGLLSGSNAGNDGGNGSLGAAGGASGGIVFSGPPPSGGNGQSAILGGGGGGGTGGFNINTFAGGQGGSGGNGGLAGGGGGGGSGQSSFSSTPAGGGNGGLFGGGGGAGIGNGSTATGGAGGQFGGGGGGSAGIFSSGSGGAGGFGAGGGGGGNTGVAAGGAAGFGAGNGGGSSAPGNGGSGLGGAVFVRQGGTLTILDAQTSGNSVAAGSGGSGGSSGQAAAQDLYIMSGVTATIGGASSTLAGSISGDGGVAISSSGSVTFNGANTYVGPTDIQSGRLAINGSITSDVAIDPGAMLGGNGIITGNVTNNGTLGPGNSIGTLTINGNYTDTAGSTMQVQINNAGSTPGVNNDLTVVNGTATLNGATVNVQAPPGTYTPGTKYIFLEATTLNGTYSSITGLTGLNVHAELGYGDILVGSTDYMTAYFTLMSNQSNFAAVAQTFNQYGVANYIDANSLNATPEMQALIDELNELTVPEQRAAFDQLTAQVNGTIAQLNVQDTTFLYMMLRRRVGSAFAAGGLSGPGGGYVMNGGPTSGSGMAGGSYGGASVMPVSQTTGRPAANWVMPLGRSYPTWGGWSAGYGLGGSAQSDGNASGGVYGSAGTITAIERPLDENNLLGFFGAYSNMSLRLTCLPQSASANQGQLGSYYLRDMGKSYFLAAGSAGFTGYRETRQMAFCDLRATANGSYCGWTPSAYLERGMRWQRGGTTLQPYGALQYIYVRQNAFTETCAGLLNQSVDGIDTHALRGLLGSRLSQVWETKTGTVFVPELRAAWMHEFLAPSTTLNAVFAPIGGGSFAARGLNFGRDWALLGGGTQYIYSQRVSLFANYDLLFNANQAWNAGSGGVQYTW